MTRTRIYKKLRLAAQYVPFTLNAVLYTAAFWLIFRFVFGQPSAQTDEQEVSSFLPIILLMARLAVAFVFALIALSVCSTVVAWLFFKVQTNRNQDLIQLQFDADPKKNRLTLRTSIAGVFRPLLGFVKGRLLYEDLLLTDSFTLVSRNKFGKPWLRGVAGKAWLRLPDVREYQLEGAFIYFQDMLQLVSLPTYHRIPQHFQVAPVAIRNQSAEASPRKTEQNDIRSEHLHRTEGDYLNYKDFESGDDVRRIVWKVYARSRELVVRVPERYEPYVSHVFVYASFFTTLPSTVTSEAYMREMTNRFKNQIWTVYQSLVAKDFEIRYVPDQELNLAADGTPEARTAQAITASEWHQTRPIQQYFNSKQGAVLCVSSLTNPKDLEETLDLCNASTVVYFIRCSTTFNDLVALSWLKRILIRPPEDRLQRLRATWPFAPIRSRIIRQEREIAEVLKNSRVTYAIL